MRCAVFGCDSDNQSARNVCDVKFFHFPKNETICKKWLSALKRKDVVNLKTACICSKHFVESDYKLNLQHKFLNYVPKRYRGLKDDAVPTQYLYKPNAPQSNNKIIKKVRGKQLCEERLKRVQVSIRGTDVNITINESLTSKDDEISFLSEDSTEDVVLTNQASKTYIEWEDYEISNAMVLYSADSKSYRRMLRNGHPYPDIPTLKAWARKTSTLPSSLNSYTHLLTDRVFNNAAS